MKHIILNILLSLVLCNVTIAFETEKIQPTEERDLIESKKNTFLHTITTNNSNDMSGIKSLKFKENKYEAPRFNNPMSMFNMNKDAEDIPDNTNFSCEVNPDNLLKKGIIDEIHAEEGVLIDLLKYNSPLKEKYHNSPEQTLTKKLSMLARTIQGPSKFLGGITLATTNTFLTTGNVSGIWGACGNLIGAGLIYAGMQLDEYARKNDPEYYAYLEEQEVTLGYYTQGFKVSLKKTLSSNIP